MNIVVLRGTVSREPEIRSLASGQDQLAFDLATRVDDGPTESVPIVWIDPPDGGRALAAGAAVVVCGRVRRRFFRSGGLTQSRTEVVAERVVPTRQAKRARAAIDRAIAAARPEVAAPSGA